MGVTNKHRRLASINNILVLAQPHLKTSWDDFDTEDMLLATDDCWIDLKSGTAVPPNPDVLISRKTAVTWDENATCPVFQDFLRQVFCDDEELIAFIQRAVGYSLTGLTDEQILFILLGGGANGKSTFLNVLEKVMGNYGTRAASSTVVSTSRETVGDDIVSIVGSRLVMLSEIDEGQSLQEAKIKQMTGGDTIKARKLYGDYMDVRVTGKFWLATNSLPRIHGQDDGIWRRVLPIPFDRSFAAHEQDRQLPKKLEGEMAGILKWAVDGCLAWQREGLNPPQKVLDLKAQYRKDMDSISQFIDEQCLLTGNPSDTVSASVLYGAYQRWCTTAGTRPQSRGAFKSKVESLERVHHHRTSSGNQWRGISLPNEM